MQSHVIIDQDYSNLWYLGTCKVVRSKAHVVVCTNLLIRSSIPNLVFNTNWSIDSENSQPLKVDSYFCQHAWKVSMFDIKKSFGLLSLIEFHTKFKYVSACWEPYSYVSACINANLDPSIAHLAIGTISAVESVEGYRWYFFQQAFAKRSQRETRFPIDETGHHFSYT